jgi:hypothetical protein
MDTHPQQSAIELLIGVPFKNPDREQNDLAKAGFENSKTVN